MSSMYHLQYLTVGNKQLNTDRLDIELFIVRALKVHSVISMYPFRPRSVISLIERVWFGAYKFGSHSRFWPAV